MSISENTLYPLRAYQLLLVRLPAENPIFAYVYQRSWYRYSNIIGTTFASCNVMSVARLIAYEHYTYM